MFAAVYPWLKDLIDSFHALPAPAQGMIGFFLVMLFITLIFKL